MEFIFMLTQDDRTVADAMDVYHNVASTDLKFVGFKDVGADGEMLRRLADTMHDDGRIVFLEVVSTSRDEELRSVQAALGAGVDYLLGGTHVDDVLPMIAGSEMRYCPFPGTIVGHPSELRGSLEEIADAASHMTGRNGVTGVDLLAFRHHSVDPIELTRQVVAASDGPVIAAGSVDSEKRIVGLAEAGAWAFTIGGAIFAGDLPGAPSLPAQVQWAMEVASR